MFSLALKNSYFTTLVIHIIIFVLYDQYLCTGKIDKCFTNVEQNWNIVLKLPLLSLVVLLFDCCHIDPRWKRSDFNLPA